MIGISAHTLQFLRRIRPDIGSGIHPDARRRVTSTSADDGYHGDAVQHGRIVVRRVPLRVFLTFPSFLFFPPFLPFRRSRIYRFILAPISSISRVCHIYFAYIHPIDAYVHYIYAYIHPPSHTATHLFAPLATPSSIILLLPRFRAVSDANASPP